jgi:hypothetical protein
LKHLRHIAETLGIALFSMVLPFVFVAALVWGSDVTGVNADGIWLIKVVGTILMPFGMVFWYIAIHHLLLRRRAGYLMQLVVFFSTAFLMYMLMSCGIYSIRV